jgi:hypothetical protein
MRLSKETVARREAKAADLFKSGLDIIQVNDTLFQEDGHRMAIGRLYELRDKHQPKIEIIEAKPGPVVETKEFFPGAKLSDPNAFSKTTTLFKGSVVTVELMEK